MFIYDRNVIKHVHN